MKVGIDLASFYLPNQSFDLSLLAKERGFEEDYYRKHLGIEKIACCAPDEDPVTLGANALYQMRDYIEWSEVDTILVATESGVDESKSSGLYIHGLLNLPSTIRVIELKQACYSGMAALRFASALIREDPRRKIIVLASDVASYSLYSPAESNQGAGAVALLLSANPRLLTLEIWQGVYSQDIDDFWRPSYSKDAIVRGQYSTKTYLKFLEKSWENFRANSQLNADDFSFFCFHCPFPALVEMGFQKLTKKNSILLEQKCINGLQSSLIYSRKIGNAYSASLFISLISLLENSESLKSGDRIGIYSYGSGSIGEFGSLILNEGWQNNLFKEQHQNLLGGDKSRSLSYNEFLRYHDFKLPQDGSVLQIEEKIALNFRLSGIAEHRLIYQKSAK